MDTRHPAAASRSRTWLLWMPGEGPWRVGKTGGCQRPSTIRAGTVASAWSHTVTGLIAADLLHASRQRLPAQLSRMGPRTRCVCRPLLATAVSFSGLAIATAL